MQGWALGKKKPRLQYSAGHAMAAYAALPAREVAFVSHCRAAKGVLQSLQRTLVASTTTSVGAMLAVMLHECLQLGATHVQGASKIERNIGRMVSPRLAVLVGPVAEKLPFIGAFFGHFYGGFLHIHRR